MSDRGLDCAVARVRRGEQLGGGVSGRTILASSSIVGVRCVYSTSSVHERLSAIDTVGPGSTRLASFKTLKAENTETS